MMTSRINRRFVGRRQGLSLIEVLVAIFVMGIGLLCLLTLFPLGAMRMASAFKDQSAAECSINARAFAAMKNLRNDPAIAAKFINNGVGQDTDATGPGYPVFVDPAGSAYSAMLGSNIARVSPSYAPTGSVAATQFFSLLDGITFSRGMGTPRMFGANIEREIGFTWAYLLQRQRAGDAAVTNATVCVFQRRPKAGQLETEYAALMNPSENSMTISYTGNAPNIVPGMWILDNTVKAPNKYAFGNFYRITGVRDVAGGLALDLQTPLQGYTVNFTGQVVIMEGLVEVFDLGPGR